MMARSSRERWHGLVGGAGFFYSPGPKEPHQRRRHRDAQGHRVWTDREHRPELRVRLAAALFCPWARSGSPPARTTSALPGLQVRDNAHHGTISPMASAAASTPTTPGLIGLQVGYQAFKSKLSFLRDHQERHTARYQHRHHDRQRSPLSSPASPSTSGPHDCPQRLRLLMRCGGQDPPVSLAAQWPSRWLPAYLLAGGRMEDA